MGTLANKESQFQADSAEQSQYLTFQLGGEMYAIGILAIKEIIEFRNLTEVPMMPDFIRGVINLRGAVMPVIDLAVRFGKNRSEINRRSCIVILEVKTDDDEVQDIGIIVDSVNEVIEILQSDIEPPPAFGTKIRTSFIQGMGKIEGNFVIILNVARALSIDDMAALSEIMVDSQPENVVAE